MGYSINSVTYDGDAQHDLNFTLGYASRDDVTVEAIKSGSTVSIDVAFDWLTDSRIEIVTTDLDVGDVLTFKRTVSKEELPVDLTGSGNATRESLDLIALHAAYIAHEILDLRIDNVEELYPFNQYLISIESTLASFSSAVSDFETTAADSIAIIQDAVDQSDNIQALSEHVDDVELALQERLAPLELLTNRFNPLAYIMDEVGGLDQIPLIFGTEAQALTQDKDIITAGLQKSIAAACQFGGNFEWQLPPNGRFLINDELTAGEYSPGVTVGQFIRAGGLSNSSIGADMIPTFDFNWSQIWVAGDFLSSEQLASNFVDKTVFRFEQDSKRTTGPRIKNMHLYWHGTRAERWKCPTALKLDRSNFSSVDGLIIRGENYDWPGDGIHFENINNSQFMGGWRIKAGTSLVNHNVYVGGGRLFDVSTTNGNVGTLLTGQSGTPFAIPAGGDSTYFDGLWLALGRNASDTTDYHWAQVKTRISDTAVELEAAHSAPKDSTGVNIGFGTPLVNMTAGSNVVTFQLPLLDDDMAGRRVTVRGVGMESDSERAYLSAFIKHGSISADKLSCELVTRDGTTAANARVSSPAGGSLIFVGSAFYFGQTSGNIVGNNNDMHFVQTSFEKGGTAIFENCDNVNFVSTKFHGRAGTTVDADQDFAATGPCMMVDNSFNINCSPIEFDHPLGFDPVTERAYAIDIAGGRTRLSITNHQIFGGCNGLGMFEYEHAGIDSMAIVGNGLMNIIDWGHPDNNQTVIHLPTGGDKTAANSITGSGVWKLRYSAAESGVTDIMARYTKNDTYYNVEISGGDITVEASGVYLVESEGSTSTDSITNIEGGLDGMTVLLKPANASRTIIVDQDAGGSNIQLAASANKNMTQKRDSVHLQCYDDIWREIGAI